MFEKLKLPPQLTIAIRKVFVITVGYVFISVLLFLLNYSFLISEYSNGPSQLFNVRAYILTSLVIGLIAGTLGGIILVFVNEYLFRKRSFRFALTATVLAYTLIFILITTLLTLVNVDLENEYEGINVIEFVIELWKRLDFTLITYFLLWGVITLFTLFLIQVNDKFGPGILLKFLAGKYYQPKTEQRFFMFLDMRSSTLIAEKIGNEKYFNLLRDFFSDITTIILNCKGEIYQYVGDEVVITWSLKNGKQNGNCIKCYEQIQQKLLLLEPVYDKKYRIMPEFKAGLHFGTVMAGEIGIIKKDIIYSGDVLNTTSRIQELCNKYDVDILLSEDVISLMPKLDGVKLIPIGIIKLRGKNQDIALSTIKF